MPEIPTSMREKGPVPRGIVTLKAQSALTENLLVTFGTLNQTCEKAGATDFVLGWSQGIVAINELATIELVIPHMWKGLVVTGSGAISFGDTLEAAALGTVKKAVTGSGSTIVGKAMNDATAGNYVQFIPIVCCPTAASS